MAFFVKFEGAVYSVIVAGMCVAGSRLYKINIFSKEHSRDFFKVVLPVAVVVSGYLLFKYVNGIGFGETGKTTLEFSANVLYRFFFTAKQILLNMVKTGNWGWNWLLFVWICFTGYRVFQLKHFQYILISIGAFIGFDIALFVLTPNFHWIFSQALLSRLLLHYFPLLPFASAIVLEKVFSEKIK